MTFPAHLMTHTCTVRTTNTGARDATGHKTAGTPSDVTGVECRLEELHKDEQFADSEAIIATHLLYTNQEVTERNQIIIDSTTFEVIQVLEARGRKSIHHWEARLRETTP